MLPRHKTIFPFRDSWKHSKPEPDAHRGEFSRHIDMSITSEKFRLRPVIGRTMFFTSDKNRPTNQIRSSY